MAGWLGGGRITLGIMQTQPSLAGVGAGAELGKKEHVEQVKTCWNFESNRCPFAEDLCWFRHTNLELPQEKYDCKFCGEVFKTKNDLQIHKKTKHSETVPYCTNDKYWYRQEMCWFRHMRNEKEILA